MIQQQNTPLLEGEQFANGLLLFLREEGSLKEEERLERTSFQLSHLPWLSKNAVYLRNCPDPQTARRYAIMFPPFLSPSFTAGIKKALETLENQPRP